MEIEFKKYLIDEMEKLGYWFDIVESYDECVRFNGDYGVTMIFDSWVDVEDWLNGVVID